MYEKIDEDTPCEGCDKQVPDMCISNKETIEIYNQVQMFRDMNGVLDINTLFKIMDFNEICNEEQLEIFEKVREIELYLLEERNKKNNNNFEKNSHENIKKKMEENKMKV